MRKPMRKLIRKLVPETLAAGLALAAVCGQACAAMQSGANAVPAIGSRGVAVSANGELKSRANFNQREARLPRAVMVAAGSPQLREIPTAQDDVPEVAKFKRVANARRAPRATVMVPEPGGWATALAGLLGVIAIARRRMSV